VKPKSWSVISVLMGEVDLMRNQVEFQVMEGVVWSTVGGATYWKEKVEEFLEVSRPGDILDVAGKAFVIRERPTVDE
jgi:hypothetical protein